MDHLSLEAARLRAALAAEPSSPSCLERMRVWQRECGATIGQLSGGNKQHWLSRAYSKAYLPDSPQAEVGPAEIVRRIASVLQQAQASLQKAPLVGAASAASRRSFEFVHEEALRPSLEATYADSRRALENGDFALALVTACSVLEAVLTDALEHARTATGGWSFEARVACAEQAKLISNGCTRLSDAARRYRSLLDEQGELREGVSVSEAEARLAGQVLNVILRDLEPGR